jgi:chemotaxis protein MotB
MAYKYLLPLVLLLAIASSCVSSKKFKSLNGEYDALKGTQATTQSDLTKCQADNSGLIGQKKSLEDQNAALNNQVSLLKENNTQYLAQLENMSVISKEQAESIKKSMENLGMKDAYIQTLQQQMAQKDSLNMALVMNLKGAIGNLEDQDINIKVDKGVVIIDISDKLLFKSGKYEVTDKAKTVLDKVAKVLKSQPDLEFMVEGHTDNVPYKGNGVLVDNWDLSVKRATTVVRLLQTQYNMDPKKMLAAGRSEYNPVTDNDTSEGKAANRRTRIVILPQLDQFFKLLEPQKTTTTSTTTN